MCRFSYWGRNWEEASTSSVHWFNWRNGNECRKPLGPNPPSGQLPQLLIWLSEYRTQIRLWQIPGRNPLTLKSWIGLSKMSNQNWSGYGVLSLNYKCTYWPGRFWPGAWVLSWRGLCKENSAGGGWNRGKFVWLPSETHQKQRRNVCGHMLRRQFRVASLFYFIFAVYVVLSQTSHAVTRRRAGTNRLD